MSRPRILDLYSCAGGAGYGYHLAGFDVVGVDIDPQPRYPFTFRQADALGVLHGLLIGGSVGGYTLDQFDAIHASPPCQAYSITQHAHTVEHPDLLEPTRQLILETGLPYVIENVPGAPLLQPVTLCGTEFGLRAGDVDGKPLALRRHRLFESNVWLMGAGGCSHDETQVAGSYTGSRHRKPEHRDNPERRGGYTPAVSVRAQLLGIDWNERTRTRPGNTSCLHRVPGLPIAAANGACGVNWDKDSDLWQSLAYQAGFRRGYHQGKANGLSESGAAGELAVLRQRIEQLENERDQ